MTSSAPKSVQPSSVQPSSSGFSTVWRFIKRLFGHFDPPAESSNKPLKALDLSDPRFYCRVRLLERCYRKDSVVEATRKRLEHHWEEGSA